VNDPAPTTPAGWFPDPLGRYDHRWFNGTTWTSDVSLHGQRYVDPAPLIAGPVQGWATPARRSRTMAVLALIVGLAALSTAWMPFFVVLGIGGGIAAITLGIIAVRRVGRGTADGRGLAVAGIVLGGLALAVSPVGIALTATAYREILRFAQPGRVVTTIDQCTASGGSLMIAGTIENREDDERDYVIDIAVSSPGDDVEHRIVSVDDVAPGATEPWSISVTSSVTSPTCRLDQVTGPYPFGLEPTG
jgi:hypothetical protein